MPCLDLLFLISSMWMFPKNIECEVHQVLLVLKCLRSYRNSKVTTKKVKTSGIWSPVGRVSQEYSSCLLICPQRLCLQLALGPYKNSFCDSMKLLAIMIYFLSMSFFLWRGLCLSNSHISFLAFLATLLLLEMLEGRKAAAHGELKGIQ